ncbi:MAG: hypothetical protein V7749_11050 [Cocleimonas sp.]
MKNDKNISLELFSFSTINTQQYVQTAHKLRGEAMAEHFGVIKNVFKRKTSATKFKK